MIGVGGGVYGGGGGRGLHFPYLSTGSHRARAEWVLGIVWRYYLVSSFLDLRGGSGSRHREVGDMHPPGHSRAASGGVERRVPTLPGVG